MNIRNKKSQAEKSLESLVGHLTLQGLIESIREGEEWPKKEMAYLLGVSPTYYSDFVAGKKPVSPQKAAKWASLLGYDPLQFVELAIQDQLERNDLPFKVQLRA